jgi:hypothetical protein
VSTLDSSFNEVTGSERVITDGPKAGTQDGSTYTYGTTYYLWGKVIDNRGFSNSYVYLDISHELVVYIPPPSNPAITLSKLTSPSHQEINLTIQQNGNSIYTLLHYLLSYTITNVAANLPGTEDIERTPVVVNLDKSTSQIVLPLRQLLFPVLELHDKILVTVTKIYQASGTLSGTYSATTATTIITSSLVTVKKFYISGYNNTGQAGYTLANNDMLVVENIPPGLGFRYYTSYTNIQAGLGFMLMNLNGKIWTTGRNSSGQCGLGNFTSPIENYTQIPSLTGEFKMLYSGIYTVFAVSTNNEVYAWGLNIRGQAGILNEVNINIPTRILTGIVSSSNKVLSIGGNIDSSLILTENGLYVSGRNPTGERADGIEGTLRQFTLVANEVELDFRNVIEVTCGYYNSYFLTKDSQIYACGQTFYGQCGILHTPGVNRAIVKPQRVTAFDSAARPIKKMISNRAALYIIDANNMLWGIGRNVPNGSNESQHDGIQCFPSVPIRFIYTRPFSEDLHVIGTNGKVYFSGTKFASFQVDAGYILTATGDGYYKLFRNFIEVDSFVDDDGFEGVVKINNKISNIFATNVVTFYST